MSLSNTVLARLKPLLGIAANPERSVLCIPDSEVTIASASDISIPDDGVFFSVSGSTGVATMTPISILAGRIIYITGATGASFAVTDTAYSTNTIGVVHLSAAFTGAPGAFLILRMETTGAWSEIGRAVNG